MRCLVGCYAGKATRRRGNFDAVVGGPRDTPSTPIHGFVPHVRRQLLGKLKPVQVAQCPLTNLPDSSMGRWGGGVTADQMSWTIWTRPKLVTKIRFVEWTAEGRLSQAAFLGLRTDKTAKDVLPES